MTPSALLVAVIDVGLLGCLVLAWVFLWRRGINGPCQLSLALLGAAHLGELARRWPEGIVPVTPWLWLWQTAFGFVFLYTMVHIGWLIEAARRSSRPRQRVEPAAATQFASRPGRPRGL